jgi:hypothetical protein
VGEVFAQGGGEAAKGAGPAGRGRLAFQAPHVLRLIPAFAASSSWDWPCWRRKRRSWRPLIMVV